LENFLAAKTKALNKRTVTSNVNILQVTKQTATLTN
jgi:hypothetical protein